MKHVLPRLRSPTRFLSCDLATAAARLARFVGTAFSEEEEPALSQDWERFRLLLPPLLLQGWIQYLHITEGYNQ